MLQALRAAPRGRETLRKKIDVAPVTTLPDAAEAYVTAVKAVEKSIADTPESALRAVAEARKAGTPRPVRFIREQPRHAWKSAPKEATAPVANPCPKCGKALGSSPYRVCKACAIAAQRREAGYSAAAGNRGDY